MGLGLVLVLANGLALDMGLALGLSLPLGLCLANEILDIGLGLDLASGFLHTTHIFLFSFSLANPRGTVRFASFKKKGTTEVK